MDFDLGESGFSEMDVDIGEMVVKKTRKYDRIWNVKFGGSICGKPFISGNVLVFGALDQYVYAIDLNTHETLWKTRLDGMILDASPIIKNSVVYLGSFDGCLYAMDFPTGSILWKFQTGQEVNTTPGVEDKIYFGSRDGNVYCLSLEGKELWRFRTGDNVSSSPVIHNGKLFVASFDKNLYCLDSRTGKEIWRFKTGAEIENDYPFAIQDDMIFVASFDNNMYAINTETGKEIWRFRTGQYGNCSAPTLFRGILYYGSRDGILFAIDAKSGSEIWRFRTGKEIIDKGPYVTNDRVYLGAGDFNVYCIDRLSGSEIWRYKTDGGIFTGIVENNGVLYFGSWDCHLYGLDLDGKEVFRFVTSTNEQSYLPPAFEMFKTEVKQETFIEDSIEEDKYKSKEKSVSLSDYQIESEYTTKSEYSTKSKYQDIVILDEEINNINLRPQFILMNPVAATTTR